MIHADDESAVRAAFEAAGYAITGPLTIGGFMAHPADQRAPIDVLTSDASWLPLALANPMIREPRKYARYEQAGLV